MPLSMVKMLSELYPDAWERLDRIHENDGKRSAWCWLTLKEAALYAASHNPDEKLYVRAVQLFVAAPWRHSKQIFAFDKTLENELIRNTDPADEIPTDVLMRLPYPSIYIQVSSTQIFGTVLDGFFVALSEDEEGPELVFLALGIGDKPGFSFQLYIRNGMTISESFRLLALKTRARENTAEYENAARTLLPLVLYLCADESDIRYHGKAGGEGAGDPPDKMKGAPIRDRFGEIRTWDVGYRIGPAIRKYRESGNDAEPGSAGSHSRKRPHIRRAHWHHYWRGPREGERQLIVRWLSPMYINASEKKSDIPAVIHPVH